jgi:hypothetical protein
MLDEIEKDNASGILAWNPDRLARNSIDGGRIIYLVDTGKIQSLNSPPSGLRRRRKENLCFQLPSDKRNIIPTI